MDLHRMTVLYEFLRPSNIGNLLVDSLTYCVSDLVSSV